VVNALLFARARHYHANIGALVEVCRMQKILAGILLSLTLTACGPVEEEPAPPEPQPESHAPKTIGPVVTLHCTLKHFNTGQVSTGTYLKYDMRTDHIPTNAMLGGELEVKLFKRDLESFKLNFSGSRLDEGWVEVPTPGPDNKYKLDAKRIWFFGYLTQQYHDPVGKSGSTEGGLGYISFGGRMTNNNGTPAMKGYLSFMGQGKYGGQGTWHMNTGNEMDPYNDDWGYFNCAFEQPSAGSIREPAGLRLPGK
jgi:hypothetical protein